ncbi:MAG TPA: hypothetical protein GX701_01060 [Clostridiales bacterium]|nr:hypothetical protein [Clostridiales bacterium]
MGKTSRNFWLLLITALFVMFSLVLVFILTGAFRRPDSTIVLPDPNQSGPAGLDGLAPVYLNEPAEFLAMDLNEDNIVSVIQSLQRPEHYAAIYKEALYAAEARPPAITETSVARKNGMTRFEITPAKGRPYMQLVTEKYLYSFQNGSAGVVKTHRGPWEHDRLGSLPSYIILANQAKARIVRCGVEERDGIFLIVVEAQVGNYRETYAISLVHGLLVSLESKENGTTVYQLSLERLDLTEPADALFLLPNGQMPE